MTENTKRELNSRVQLCKVNEDLSWYVELECSNVIPSIDTYLLPPYCSDWIWCAKLATTRSEYSQWYNTPWYYAQ